MNEDEARNIAPISQYEGLNGWLVLVGIGVVLSPFVVLFQSVPVYIDTFTEETWSYLTDPASDGYHFLWMPSILFELAARIVLLCADVYLIFLFFTKKRMFPKLYIILIFAYLGLVFIVEFFYLFTVPEEAFIEPEIRKELSSMIGAICIWVPYMLVSKRVKATFVN